MTLVQSAGIASPMSTSAPPNGSIRKALQLSSSNLASCHLPGRRPASSSSRLSRRAAMFKFLDPGMCQDAFPFDAHCPLGQSLFAVPYASAMGTTSERTKDIDKNRSHPRRWSEGKCTSATAWWGR